ncbi:acyl-CoA dehydrogenase [Roseospirillum parvum]|uniref:Butyryl-CoA dehydrogenase n=1 Tax=Roseospirillum parvum TaxID=83401 RepID=A0A1G7UQP6_9PROT|nr:acyl-CoA dehydrogenase [Roseospirillum parvum]SDG49843.1 butyryl-CoA dehydrogenase [Roseospirillum parvum]
MDDSLIPRRELDFLLFDLLEVERLAERPRHADHGRDTIAAMLDTAEALARDHFAPHNRKADEAEPRLENGRVVTIPEVGAALRRFSEAGFMAAVGDAEWGGLQVPYSVNLAINALFSAANISTMTYAFLTQAAANLISVFGSQAQKETWLPPLLAGDFFGTMALTEPQAGSSLADLRTRAEPQEDGSYRLFGAKIFISGGEHELARNIVHLVLARLPDAPPGVKGISLFLVPRFLPGPDGAPGEKNDIALAGLIHKMGYRGTTSTLLNFGEAEGATGWLVGEAGQGLAAMFHMMNESRVIVGNGAAALGHAGYRQSLAYARERAQGRPPGAKDPATPQVPILRHADVKRMLLAQKAYAEGALALTLYCGRLIDDEHTADDAPARAEARRLLDILTPIAKSWPSQWCLEGNNLAIQVLGGYGYTRDYPVEQTWRDNRLNPIHEGTHGIQAQDLLGRKVRQEDGAAFALLCDRIEATIAASRDTPPLASHAGALENILVRVRATTAGLLAAMAGGRAETALGHASVYLEALGHVVVAWLWLKQARVAQAGLDAAPAAAEHAFLTGKLAACHHFFAWELPRVGPWLDGLAVLDGTWASLPEDCF